MAPGQEVLPDPHDFPSGQCSSYRQLPEGYVDRRSPAQRAEACR